MLCARVTRGGARGPFWMVTTMPYLDIPLLEQLAPDGRQLLSCMKVLIAWRDATLRCAAPQVLYSTWGRRDGDAAYPGLYPDFETMNELTARGGRPGEAPREGRKAGDGGEGQPQAPPSACFVRVCFRVCACVGARGARAGRVVRRCKRSQRVARAELAPGPIQTRMCSPRTRSLCRVVPVLCPRNWSRRLRNVLRCHGQPAAATR